MASNYSLSTARFTPLTYSEITAPLISATQAQQAAEDQLATMINKSSYWDSLKDSEIDRPVYNRYRSYQDKLEAARDSLISNGLNTGTRQALLDLWGQYGKEITPIENAFKTRAQQAAEQTKGEAAGLIYNYDAGTTGLDEYIKNPSLAYHTANLNDIYKTAVTNYSNISKVVNSVDSSKSLDSVTKLLQTQFGITPDQAANFAVQIKAGNYDGVKNSLLYQILDSTYNGTGVQGWQGNSSEESRRRVMNKILEASNAAIGQTNVQPFNSPAATMELQYQYGEKAANNAFERNAALQQMKAAAQSGQTGAGAYQGYNQNPIYDSVKDHSADSMRYTQHDVNLTKTAGQTLVRRLLAYSGASKIHPAEWDSTQHKWVDGSSQLDPEDLDGAIVDHVSTSSRGTVAAILKKDKSMVYVNLAEFPNKVKATQLSEKARKIEYIARILKMGRVPQTVTTKNGSKILKESGHGHGLVFWNKKLSPEEISAYQQELYKAQKEVDDTIKTAYGDVGTSYSNNSTKNIQEGDSYNQSEQEE